MTMMHRQQGKSQQRQTNQPKHSKREQLPDTLQKWRKPGGKEREREKEGEREREIESCGTIYMRSSRGTELKDLYRL